MIPVLAHAGAGASWQALVVAIGFLVAGLFLLVVLKVVKVREPSDLVLPLAGVVIVSSLATTASDSLSDQIGWVLPIGIIALGGLLWASLKPQEFTVTSRFTLILVGLAAVAGVALQGPLTNALHPALVEFDVTTLPQVDDVKISIITPQDDATVGTPFELVIEVTGGTIGGELLANIPVDPETFGNVRVLDGAKVLDVTPAESCSSDAPCTRLTYQIELTAGKHQLLVEFLTAKGTTFRSSVFALVVLDVTA
jgi:hypothetical protein